jgi:fused signal recognition particle receptor
MAFFKSILSKLKQGLEATRQTLTRGLRSLILGRQLDDTLIDDVERMLLEADVGVDATRRLIDRARADFKAGTLRRSEDLLAHLKAHIKELLSSAAAVAAPAEAAASGTAPDAPPPRVLSPEFRLAPAAPTVVLITGTNGAGKTTSIAKLAHMFRGQNKTVLLAACDTFRAGAVRQLEVWAERLGVEVVKGQQGGDPAAVAFDACKAALARGVDVLILDTAGRLHTQDPLMRQLGKIYNVAGKLIPGAPHEALLVLDATTGQNAVRQAQEFARFAPLSGLILTKLDGTAKGGVVIAIRQATSIPVKFVGTGETPDDLQPFNADEFAEAMFSE